MALYVFQFLLTVMGEKMSDAMMGEVLRGFPVGESGEFNVAELMRHLTSLDDA